MTKALKLHLAYELGFHDLVGGFHYGVKNLERVTCLSVQSTRVSNVFKKEITREWENKGRLIKRVQGCDNPILREIEANLEDGMSVLEIGCGPGKLIEHLLRQYDKCNIVGLDISKDMIDAAKDRIDGIDLRKNTVDFIVGDIEDNIIKPASFNSIILKQVVHHLYNPAQVLKKLKDYLRPGGSIILMVPGRHYQSEIFPFSEDKKDPLGRFSLTYLERIISEGLLFPVRLWEERFIFEFENIYNYLNFMSDIGSLQKLFDYDHDKYSKVLEFCKMYEKILAYTQTFHISGEYIVALCKRGDEWDQYQLEGVDREDVIYDS